MPTQIECQAAQSSASLSTFSSTITARSCHYRSLLLPLRHDQLLSSTSSDLLIVRSTAAFNTGV